MSNSSGMRAGRCFQQRTLPVVVVMEQTKSLARLSVCLTYLAVDCPEVKERCWSPDCVQQQPQEVAFGMPRVDSAGKPVRERLPS